MSDVGDWWDKMLQKYSDDGAADADKGVYDPPHLLNDEYNDPQDEDETFAYEKGFKTRREELGDKFKWQCD